MIGVPYSVYLTPRKFRGKDRQKIKRRECGWCMINNPASKYTCAGRGGLKFCSERNSALNE